MDEHDHRFVRSGVLKPETYMRKMSLPVSSTGEPLTQLKKKTTA